MMSALQQTYSYGTPESTDKDGTYMNKTNSEINTEVITINFQGFPTNKFKIEYFLPPNHSLSSGQYCCCSVQ